MQIINPFLHNNCVRDAGVNLPKMAVQFQSPALIPFACILFIDGGGARDAINRDAHLTCAYGLLVVLQRATRMVYCSYGTQYVWHSLTVRDR